MSNSTRALLIIIAVFSTHLVATGEEYEIIATPREEECIDVYAPLFGTDDCEDEEPIADEDWEDPFDDDWSGSGWTTSEEE